MTEYMFVLGRDHELSILEAIAYLKRKNIEHEVTKWSSRYMIIKADNIENIIEDLGGTVKIAKLISTTEWEYDLDHMELYEGEKNKIKYGVTLYSHRESDFLMDYLKQRFKEMKLKAMLTKSEGHIDPNSDLDIEFIVAKEGLFMVTERSNPKSYKERDMKRPRVDTRKVISIRLAKILLNLAMVEDGGTILDPFCGCGTILQEGVLMDYKMRGIDLDIGDAKANMDWLGKGDYKIWQNEARNLGKYVTEVDAMVTEPYLGPFFKIPPKLKEANDVAKELRDMYFRVFYELKKVVKGNIVFITPIFKLKGGKEIEVSMKRIFDSLDSTELKFSSMLRLLFIMKGLQVLLEGKFGF